MDFDFLCLSGIESNRNPIWDTLGVVFKDEFPSSRGIVREEINCPFYGVRRFRSFRDRIVKELDDGRKFFIIGHSMGGLLGCAMTPLFKRSRVIGIVTLFSPHQTYGGIFSRALGAPRDPGVPILSYGIENDILVPYGARHPLAIQHTVIHSNVRHGHLWAIVKEPHHSRMIAKDIKKFFFPRPEA